MPFGNGNGGLADEACVVDGDNARRHWRQDIVGFPSYLGGRQTGQRRALVVHCSLLQGHQAESTNSF